MHTSEVPSAPPTPARPAPADQAGRASGDPTGRSTADGPSEAGPSARQRRAAEQQARTARALSALGAVPFTWTQARKAGMPLHALTGCRRLARGVYLRSDVAVDCWVEARATLLIAGREAFVSHHLAARIYGGVVPDTPYWHASIAAGRTRSRHERVTVHRSRRTPTVFGSIRITSPADTFLDLAGDLDLVDLVVLGDSLVKKKRITPAGLVAAMDAAAGSGVRLARRAARLVRHGVDSPMETRSRMLRVLSGLPELETDIRLYGADGELRRRLDAGDRESRTAVEYDGRHHIQREDQWEADLGRREELEDDEWRIVVLVARDLYTTPGRTIERLAKIFRARGMVVGPLSDEWRRYFPDRSTT